MTQESTDELERHVECHMAMTSQLTSLLLHFIYYGLVELEARIQYLHTDIASAVQTFYYSANAEQRRSAVVGVPPTALCAR